MLESTEKKVDEEEEGVEPAMPDVDKLVTVQIVLTVISIVIALMISIVSTRSCRWVEWELTRLRRSSLWGAFLGGSEKAVELIAFAGSQRKSVVPAPKQQRTILGSVRVSPSPLRRS